MTDEERTEMTSEEDNAILSPGMELHSPQSMSFTGRNPHFVLSLNGILPDKVWLSLKAAGSEVAKMDGQLKLAGVQFDFPSAGSLDYTHATPLLFEGFRGAYPLEPIRRECWAGAPVRITAPLGPPVWNPVLVKGEGAPGARIRIVRDDNRNVFLSDYVAVSNSGTWEVELNQYLAQNVGHRIVAQMSFGAYPPVYSETVLLLFSGLVFTSPAPSEVVLSDKIVFKGRADLLANPVTVVNQENLNEVVSVVANPDLNTRLWEAAAKETLRLPSGVMTVRSRYLFENKYYHSDPLTFRVLGIPVITAPASGSQQNQTFTLSGNQGLIGAKVEIFKGLGTTKFGESGVLTSANWTAQVTVDPGSQSLVALQNHSGKQSPRGTLRTFKVLPPKLTSVTVTPLANAALRFSGTGYADATVDVTKVSGPGSQAVPPVKVSDAGTWQVDSTNWPPGQYSFKATQKVSDENGGWIVSTEYTFSYTLVLPAPTVSHTGDYTPVFSGTGYTGATVVLFNQGGSKVAPDARVSGGRWSSTASEVWGPTWKRRVQLRQELGGQTSEGWVEIEVSIAPLAPDITDITGIDDGQYSPTFKGTCWGGAEVKLRFSDTSLDFPATVSGNQWTFRRGTPFAADITHTVTVTQYAAGQDSPAATRAFSLERFIPQPVFTAPAAGSEVGPNLLVKGRGGIAGGKIELHDAQFSGLVGASDSLIADGDWEVQLNNLAFRDFTLYALQLMGERTSERSAVRSFKVVVLPPEIEVPAPDGTLPRIARISGKGLPRATVDVWLQGVAEPILTGIRVDIDGLWQSEVITLEIGRHSLRARQTFQGLPSKDTPAQAFRVVPLAPTIETPVDAVPVGRGVMVSGFGHPGDTVAVALSTAPQTALGRAPVLADRTWSVAVELVVAAGDHDLIAIASSGEFHSDASLPRKVRVGPYLPSIDVPAPSRWVTDPVAFAGKGQPGVGELVSWFNPERVVARDIPVTANGWQIDATIRLPQGGYWVRFRQVIGSGGSAIHSDWADSRRFEVVPSPPGSSRY